MPIDGGQLAVLLFTQREYAEEFCRSFPDMPASAVVVRVEVPNLRGVLAEQQHQGRTHVLTDPILGSSKYLEQHTLTMNEYLNRLDGC